MIPSLAKRASQVLPNAGRVRFKTGEAGSFVMPIPLRSDYDAARV
jgi:hypothetical protein